MTNETFSPGQILRQEREKRGLTTDEVASLMRLSRPQVEAIERDDYASLPGNVFVRGFVRNYAKLLQIDPAPLLEAIELPQEMIAPAQNEGIPFPTGQKRSWVHYAIGFVILAFFVLVYEMYRENRLQEHPVPEVKPSPTAVAPLRSTPEESAPAPVPSAVPESASEPASAPVPVSAPVSALAVPRSVPAAVSAPVATGPIRLVFDDSSWVEVRDADGRIVFSRLNPAGSEQFVSGKAPFSLVIGNAHHVRLFYEGKPVDLSPYIKVAVARFTLQ